MPIIKSAIKRVRQQTKRRQRNLVVKSAIKQDIRAVMTSLEGKDAKAIQAALAAAYSEIDRGVKKGTLHKNTAARRKSRLAATIKRAEGDQAKPVAKTKAKAKPATKAKSSRK